MKSKLQNGKNAGVTQLLAAPLLMLGVLLYIVYVFISQQVQMHKLNAKIKANNEKIIQKEQETKRLLKEKEKYQSDEYIEKMAREKLGYVKPGEKVYIDKSHQQ